MANGPGGVEIFGGWDSSGGNPWSGRVCLFSSRSQREPAANAKEYAISETTSDALHAQEARRRRQGLLHTRAVDVGGRLPTVRRDSLEVNYGMSGFPDEAMSVNGQPCVIPYADRLVSGLAHEGWPCALSEF